jgi:putative (di)nucleoside polyphosphate hydrolase
MLANRSGQIFVAQRLDNKDSAWRDCWQMPQGGIDEGEDARAAAMRELTEETGIAPALADILGEYPGDLLYDLPDDLMGKIWGGKYRGQSQRWFLMRFTGEDQDIDIATENPEFSHWKWADPGTLVEMIVPFKRDIYRQLLHHFGPLI